MYDAIVIGARCAGLPTAMLLARRGHRVLLVDRARLPSDTMSTYFIHPPGIAALLLGGQASPSTTTETASCRIVARSPVVEPMPIVIDLCPPRAWHGLTTHGPDDQGHASAAALKRRPSRFQTISGPLATTSECAQDGPWWRRAVPSCQRGAWTSVRWCYREL